MASFAFVPRKFAKSVKITRPPASIPDAQPSTSEINPKKEAAFSDEDLIFQVSLAFSDYRLWADPDTRRIVGSDGFVSLRSLMDCDEVSEAAIAKCLRSNALDHFEIRLVLQEPDWHGRRNNNRGMYEVRRKFSIPDEMLTRDHWNKRTVYVENVPLQFRSVAGIARFIHDLLPAEKSLPRVQAVSLLAHHLDKPGDKPKCKGFAFVILSAIEDVEFLLSTWPWSREPFPSKQVLETPTSQEALKFGFRALSKSRYDNLKNEFLTYRTSLVEQTVRNQNPTESVAQADHPPPETIPPGDFASSYPVSCLIFTRNVHPETNKTTLKNLFGRAFQTAPFDTNGVDYVDYNKGLDACHLRLASPKHSNILLDYFTQHSVVQKSGLDAEGSVATANEKSITMELVQDQREEMYWNKLPAKIRDQAMETYARWMNSSNVQEEDHNRKKKRRK